MGFGWLLVGYFFSNVMSLYTPLSFAKLIGYPMMVFGLYHLAHYHDRFRYCWYFSFASLPFALYFSFYGLSQLGIGTQWWILGGIFLQAVEWAYAGMTLILHAMLLYAIIGLCAELRLIGIQSNACRNLIMVGLYYALYLFARLPFAFVQENAGFFALPLVLLRISFLILNMMLIFNCYRYICSEGDEHMNEPLSKRQRRSFETDEEDDEHNA